MGVALRRKPNRARPRRRAFVMVSPAASARHRVFDMVGALLLLVLALPPLLLGMFATALTGRPIFFGHRRLGLGGRSFLCWKLRTMSVDAEERLDREPELFDRYVRNGYKLPAATDPRITFLGRVLRHTYIDEIPQLFNVLRGEMSLIGPRPIVEAELRNYGPRGDDLLRAKPGLIGAWTSLGRRRPPYPIRARLELEYVRNRSLLGDLRILLRSVPVVLRGQSDEM
ncbi:MAG: sugar transferase [Longimicrobiales bacterium]